ncbi:cupin domain-containing protein [Variovorax sp. LjRoot290]|uniref:cupin domain-containing protein n=1 Tax=unclassified Variovorax TaxID=663243 RepID=UPI000883A824|nr:cupin domain-containing protein [Variovorax sp. CF079]SDC03982.1 Cupin domain-containing protein [Variovorax sp. CF079]
MTAIARNVISHATLPLAELPGITHRTLAGHEHGLTQLSIWKQTLAPGASTPPHSHDTEEVVLCHAGRGEVHLDGQVHRFGPASSVLLPRDVPHQIFNVGDEPMEITGVFPAAPVGVFDLEAKPMQLPW